MRMDTEDMRKLTWNHIDGYYDLSEFADVDNAAEDSTQDDSQQEAEHDQHEKAGDTQIGIK